MFCFSFHNNLKTKDCLSCEDEVEPRRFLCRTCNKRNWRSIETFRLHKSRCRGGDMSCEILRCTDCSAEFDSSEELREHVRVRDSGHETHVCPLHCGAAFSSNTCLQHHQVACFSRQKLGPFHVVDCRNEN